MVSCQDAPPAMHVLQHSVPCTAHADRVVKGRISRVQVGCDTIGTFRMCCKRFKQGVAETVHVGCTIIVTCPVRRKQDIANRLHLAPFWESRESLGSIVGVILVTPSLCIA